MEIRVTGLTKHYVSEGRSVKALDVVDLTIPANHIFTLLGPSGCGKTTLLRCIVGLETPDDGEIRIGDEVVWSRRGYPYVAAGVLRSVWCFCPSRTPEHCGNCKGLGTPLPICAVNPQLLVATAAPVLGVDGASCWKQLHRVELLPGLAGAPHGRGFDDACQRQVGGQIALRGLRF